MAQENEQQEWIRVQKVEIPGCRVFVMPNSLLLLSENEREDEWAQAVAERREPAVLWLQAVEMVHNQEVRPIPGKANDA